MRVEAAERLAEVEEVEHSCRGRANMAHIRQSRPDYGLGFHVGDVKILQARLVTVAAPARERTLLSRYPLTLPANMAQNCVIRQEQQLRVGATQRLAEVEEY